MNIIELLDRQFDCVAGTPPACQCACPINIDILDFIGKMQQGLVSAAYRVLKTRAVFPGTACHLCSEPCRDSCVIGEISEPISLKKLEQFCWMEMQGKPSKSFFIPKKDKKILVVGGGLTGCTCAMKLAQRGYDVQLIEKEERLGGRVLSDVQDKEVLQIVNDELGVLGKHEHIDLHLERHADTLDEFTFDAALIATGSTDSTFLEKFNDGLSQNDGIFFAGSLTDANMSYLDLIRQGSETANLIEDYLKVGRAKVLGDLSIHLKYKPDVSKIETVAPPAKGVLEEWTLDDASAEAARCIQCSCNRCFEACEMMSYYNKPIRKLFNDVNETANHIILNKRRAIKYTMSCTDCRACKEACPVDIDLGELCLETRRVLNRQGKLPSGHYYYWINDMQHSNNEGSIFLKTSSTPKYLFFPGCQMGASNPEYVDNAYSWLCKEFPDMSIYLGCCGAPAFWAASEDLFNETIDGIKRVWEANGRPTFILSCPSCMEILNSSIDEIPAVYLWDLMAERFPEIPPNGEVVSVFDPCKSKYSDSTRESIRTLVRKMGYAVEELPYKKETSPCCGYGGLIYPYNKKLASLISAHNTSLGENEYITYCTNCRDTFAKDGKQTRHILDVLFDDGNRKLRPPVDLSERRRNRVILRNRLAGVDTPEQESDPDVPIVIPEEVQISMNQNLILDENVVSVMDQAIESGRYSLSKTDGIYTAYQKQGSVTFWVRFKINPTNYEIVSVYSHRMSIEGA